MRYLITKKRSDKRNGHYFLLLVFLKIILVQPILGQSNNYSLVRTSQQVTVNRTLPKNILKPGEIMPVYFSKKPTDEEIFRVHFFEEPLIPVEGSQPKNENIDLIYALAGFSQRKDADDFTSITNFLKKYPKSRWRGSLLANLGNIYRRTGYYIQAMEAWQTSWNLLKKQSDRKVKVLADKVFSELLLVNAWVGRQEKIDSLFKEIDNRVIEGPAGERVVSMRRATWLMKNKPGISFMCGPYALNKIYATVDSKKSFNDKLTKIESTPKGFSLFDLEKMANEIGLKYQMAFRKPGAEVITNSVVHWKLEHYSALLRMDSGYFRCEDATMGTVYGHEFWLSPAALDSSASGYFLVPEGVLPNGWRKVMTEEGSKIFGKGQVPADPGKNVSNKDKQLPEQCNSTPMAQSNVHAAAVSLHIFDRPIFYSPPLGPAMVWDVDYHQRDSYQPANFAYANMGPKWTYNWLSYVQDDPNNPSANATIYLAGGGAKTFALFNITTQSYAPELQTNDVLVRICPGCYELRHPDGSKDVYARPDGSTSNGRKIFLTKKVDPAGIGITLTYDASLRIMALKDTLGQVTTISYENASDIYKITKVTDPFGRSASFNYNALGMLVQVTDMIGIISSFTYDIGDFITKMTTPYGITSFIKVDGPGNYRSLETHYPLGEKEKVAFVEDAAGIPFSESIVPEGMDLTNEFLNYRNTFFWDKKAMKELQLEYTAAKIYHWLHGNPGTGENGAVAPILESTKEPLENRIWFRYENQTGLSRDANQGMSSKPYLIGRVLDDGTTQLSKFSYNSLGADTISIDPLKRKLTNKYDTNKVDLLEVRQTKNNANELLAKFTYNSQHLPLTVADASGLVYNFTYNPSGQLLTAKNPRNETTSLAYNLNGYLQSITGPLAGSTISFTYDGYGRVRTVTDPEGYIITTDYDLLDRPTVITYPDGSFEQIVYNRLDAVHSKDRLGRWSHTIYDSLRRPNVIQDALGRITQLIWCSCGSLSEIVDPLKQITTFVRDLQGRLTSKTYNDGKSTFYKYENTTSRLKEVTDAKGQKTQYSYFIDGNLKQVNYANAQVATASVSYTYDSIYNRIKTMTDGTGITSYDYKPVNSGLGSGQLATVDGPLANDNISYSYDSLGRANSRSINGIASSVIFDKLGRITSATNPLGNFIYTYVNQTERLSSISLPNGQTTAFTYFNNQDDQHLKEIWNKTSSAATISKFNYEYNKEGQITKWTQQAGAATPVYYDLGYDLADQLTSATQKNQSTSAILKRYAYRYDKAGNRTSEQIDNTVTSSFYNNVNQLTAQQNTGPMRFNGTVSEFSSVMVKNLSASDSTLAAVDTTNSFEAFVKTIAGTNNIAVSATDYSGNSNKSTNNYNITVSAGVNNTGNFDNNGNTISTTTPAVTYGWDAADRLVKITQGANITEFIYDGLSRRVAEKLNGTVIKRWLWDGTELADERNAAGNTVTKRFFPQGEQINTVNYYFTRDHLGSIREMTDVSGTVQARYDYDPYGRRTKISGSLDADFGFTGLYYHSLTGLNLALYRVYSSNIGRWFNRDPIEETGGVNQYSYVYNAPVNWIDPDGLLVFHYWHPDGGGGSKGGWYGHVSLTLDDGTYISYWPNKSLDGPFDTTPSRVPDYDKDVQGEGDRKPCDTKVENVNEKAIKEWWEKGNHGDFGTFNNCSDIVSEALRQGGLDVPYHFIYQPQNVTKDLGEILKEQKKQKK